MDMARIVFLGTPEFAVPALRALAAAHEVVAVVTQPDRAGGRGCRLLYEPAVKREAEALGLFLLQPCSLRRERAVVAALRALAPDLMVLAAFGQILRPEVLAIPTHGCLGVHASLLPRWGGAAPIAAATRRRASPSCSPTQGWTPAPSSPSESLPSPPMTPLPP
jgi:methionyl-tRNA formyltransferase